MTIYHKHHIIPKHEWKRIHGNLHKVNDTPNIILLTIEEHALAHKKLWEEYGHKEDYLAWKGLTKQISKQDIIKQIIIETNQKRKGEKRTPCSETTKQKF